MCRGARVAEEAEGAVLSPKHLVEPGQPWGTVHGTTRRAPCHTPERKRCSTHCPGVETFQKRSFRMDVLLRGMATVKFRIVSWGVRSARSQPWGVCTAGPDATLMP